MSCLLKKNSRDHWQEPSWNVFLARTIVVPYTKSPLGTTNIFRLKLALTSFSTTNRLTSFAPLWQRQRNPQQHGILCHRRYAFMKNYLLWLQQQKAQFFTKQTFKSHLSDGVSSQIMQTVLCLHITEAGLDLVTTSPILPDWIHSVHSWKMPNL